MFRTYRRYWLSSGIVTMRVAIVMRLSLNIKAKRLVFLNFLKITQLDTEKLLRTYHPIPNERYFQKSTSF